MDTTRLFDTVVLSIDFIFLIKPKEIAGTFTALTAIGFDNAGTVAERCTEMPPSGGGRRFSVGAPESRKPAPSAGKEIMDKRVDETEHTASTAALADFSARLNFGDIPNEVIERIVDLFVDWAGSALSSSCSRSPRSTSM